jgi:hypothetical protein
MSDIQKVINKYKALGYEEPTINSIGKGQCKVENILVRENKFIGIITCDNKTSLIKIENKALKRIDCTKIAVVKCQGDKLIVLFDYLGINFYFKERIYDIGDSIKSTIINRIYLERHSYRVNGVKYFGFIAVDLRNERVYAARHFGGVDFADLEMNNSELSITERNENDWHDWLIVRHGEFEKKFELEYLGDDFEEYKIGMYVEESL